MLAIEDIKNKFKGSDIVEINKAKKNYLGEYMSDRNDEGIILTCQKLNILTVEDYCKWYKLYILQEYDNEVYLISLTFGDIIDGIDHSYYPDSIVEFCKVNNIKLDATSYIAICKMCIEQFDYEDIDDHLPTKENLESVISCDLSSKNRTFYITNKYDILNYISFTKS